LLRVCAAACYDVSVTRPGVVLKTSRLNLEPVTDSDLAAFVRHFSEAQLHRYLSDDGPITYERVNAIATTSDRDFRRVGYGIWAMHVPDSTAAVGVCGLRAQPSAGVELLFWVRPRYWKLGYAREAAAAVIDYALVGLGLEQVCATCEVDNLAAASVFTRLGMLPLEDGLGAPRMAHFVMSNERYRGSFSELSTLRQEPSN
jgi:[ribosomal protein S5]-alanine N-acetyltransferase